MDKDYRFEVYTDYSDYGDKVYVVKYFDLDTVIGVGYTVEEAIEESRGNLEAFLLYCKKNNIKVPEPSIHEELDYSGKVTLRMSKSLHKLVDERAKKEGVSINLLLNEAINTYITKLDYKEKYLNKTVEKSEYENNVDRYKELRMCEDDSTSYYKSRKNKR